MLFRKLLIATSLLAFGWSGAVSAQPAGRPECALRMETSPASWIIRGFDPFNPTAPSATFEILYRNEGDRACVFEPNFLLDGESFGLANGSADRLSYSLIDLTRDANVTPISGQSLQRGSRGQIAIPPRSQSLYRFLFSVAPHAIVGDGLFAQNVVLEAWSPTDMVLGSRPLVLGLEIQPSARMGLAGAFQRSNGSALVDLGVLRDGPVALPLQLQVQSTRGYKLDFESENHGKLRLQGSDWTVDYALALDGHNIPLSQPFSYMAPRPRAVSERLPLAFFVSGSADKRAGVYTDTLTVSVAAY